MPPALRSSSPEPPAAMTWLKASPFLIVAVIFDATRLVFEQFWFFGPALATVVCTVKATGLISSITFGLLGAKTAGLICSAAAVVAGAAAAGAIEIFGIVMAMAVGLFGWLSLMFALTAFNRRIFAANTTGVIWLVLSLGVSEIPLIGSIPMLTFALAKLFRTQIQKERRERRAFEAEQAALAEQQRAFQVAQFEQMRAAEMEEIEAEEAANGDTYAPGVQRVRPRPAANDAYIPGQAAKAA